MEAHLSDRRHFFYELRAWPRRLALKAPPPIFFIVIGNQYDRFASCLRSAEHSLDTKPRRC